jgi:hypothetical protein
MKRMMVILVIGSILIFPARGQNFGNLNFESAYNLPGNPSENGVRVSVTNALPDWTAYNGSLALSTIYYVSNNFPGASTSVELEGGSLALSGNNLTVRLDIGGSISQTGIVPVSAESLEFEAQGPGPGYSLGASGLLVILGGQSLPYSALSEGPDYIVYGANIPAAMDGQMEALGLGVEQGPVLLDNIEFSTSSVPEPAEFAMIGLGAISFGFWRCCKRQRWRGI